MPLPNDAFRLVANAIHSAKVRMMIRWVSRAAVGLGMASVVALGAGPFSPARTNQVALTKPPIQEIGAGLFQIGAVRLDKNKKNVSFGGSVNMSTGVVEYAIVGRQGKRHESVFVTQAEPYHIHLAMLLLGATNQSAKAESGRSLSGHPIQVTVSWKDGEKEKRTKLEDLICKEQQSRAMTPGIWIYNGSRVVEGTFLAQRDESIIAIIDDPDALVNNPRTGRENDEIWFVNEKAVPPVGVAVRFALELGASEQ